MTRYGCEVNKKTGLGENKRPFQVSVEFASCAKVAFERGIPYCPAMNETDLYLPLKRFLESQHYEVKAEVVDCDVLAVRGEEEPVVVELKLSLNLDVVLQAVDRLSLTSKVYIGVPANTSMVSRRRRLVTKLLRMLGLGLVLISPDKDAGRVKVFLDPREYRPRRSGRRVERLFGEFAHRVGDPNLGGAEKRKGVMTAYRQRALAIARFLEQKGARRCPPAVLDPGQGYFRKETLI